MSAVAGFTERPEFQFLTVSEPSAWRQGFSTGNLVVSEDGLSLAQIPDYSLGATIAGESVLGDQHLQVEDFAIGRCLLYILNGASEPAQPLLAYDAGISRLTPIASDLLARPVSLALRGTTFYVAVKQELARLIALDGLSGEERWSVGPQPGGPKAQDLPKDYAFAPDDLAVSANGDVFALDSGKGLILKFDADGRLQQVLSVENLKQIKPVLAIDPITGVLYLMAALPPASADAPASGRPAVWRIDPAASAPAPSVFIDTKELTEENRKENKHAILPKEFTAGGLAVDRQGIIYLGEDREIVPGDEDTRFLRRFDPAGNYLGPVNVFRGVATRLIVDQQDRIFVYDKDADRIQVFEPQPAYAALPAQPAPAPQIRSQQALAPIAGATDADGGNTYFSPAFDSRTPGAAWHRVVLDVAIPPNTQVLLWVSTSDQFLTLDQVRARGVWTGPLFNPEDALLPLNTAPGRYLWIRLQLIGTRQATPTVRSLRVYFPRLSYLRYLPSVYQEDPVGRVFLERFLSIFETLLSGLESEVATFVRYLDPGAARPDFLPWLASWLGLVVDSTWSQPMADPCAVCAPGSGQTSPCPPDVLAGVQARAAAARAPAQIRLRELLKAAPDLFRRRGTRSGLEDIVRIYTGKRPYIVEQLQVKRQCGTKTELDDQATYGDNPCSFTVLLEPFSAQGDDERKAVAALIQANKPAHTCASIVALEPWMSLGESSYLGINTYLSWFTSRIEVDAAVGDNTILTQPEEL